MASPGEAAQAQTFESEAARHDAVPVLCQLLA